MRAWMFHNWIEDYGDEYKLLENQGYLIGSFINPEAVRKILGASNNDGETYGSTDEEFEKLTKQLREQNRKKAEEEKQQNDPNYSSKKQRRRKRKIINE